MLRVPPPVTLFRLFGTPPSGPVRSVWVIVESNDLLTAGLLPSLNVGDFGPHSL